MPTKAERFISQNQLRGFGEGFIAGVDAFRSGGYRHDSEEEAAVTITGTTYEYLL